MHSRRRLCVEMIEASSAGLKWALCFFNFGFSTVHVDLGFLNPNQWSQSLYDDIDGGSLFVPTVFFMNWEIS